MSINYIKSINADYLNVSNIQPQTHLTIDESGLLISSGNKIGSYAPLSSLNSTIDTLMILKKIVIILKLFLQT